MPKIRKSSLAIPTVVGAASAALLVPASAASADDYVTHFTLPAGQACEFEVLLEVGQNNQKVREYHDEDGNLVVVKTGAAEPVRATNAESGESYEIPSWGVRTEETTSDDGTTRTVQDGHTLLVLFPSDHGGGILPTPSLTLVAGHTEYTVAPPEEGGAWTITKVSGKTTDICAELSS